MQIRIRRSAIGVLVFAAALGKTAARSGLKSSSDSLLTGPNGISRPKFALGTARVAKLMKSIAMSAFGAPFDTTQESAESIPSNHGRTSA